MVNKKFLISAKSHGLKRFFIGYVVEGAPDYYIKVTDEDIRREEIANSGKLGGNFIPDELEFCAIQRHIVSLFSGQGVLLFHGSAICVDGRTYIFTAPSGTGKTTHINNWIERIPDTIVVNGDKPLIDVDSKLVYGTPWCGKEGMNTNIAVPLAGIISLERGDSNHIHSITFKEIMPTLIKQCYIPNSKELSIKALKLIGELNSIPYYKLYCNMDKESAEVAYNGVKN